MRKKEFQDDFPEKFDQLSEDLNKLSEMIRLLRENPKNQSLKLEIKKLLEKMNHISKAIGGKVLDHTHDLNIDVNLFLDTSETNLTPKIFQDFQLLKNDLRKL